MVKEAREVRARARKLEAEIAGWEARRVGHEIASFAAASASGNETLVGSFVHRATEDGVDYTNAFVAALKSQWNGSDIPVTNHAVVILITSPDAQSMSASLVILANTATCQQVADLLSKSIEDLAAQTKSGVQSGSATTGPRLGLKGGGRGTKWQGKVTGKLTEKDVRFLEGVMRGARG